MSERKPKIIKRQDRPKRVTDATDLDLIRHLQISLAKIYRKYGLDWREEVAKKTA